MKLVQELDRTSQHSRRGLLSKPSSFISNDGERTGCSHNDLDSMEFSLQDLEADSRPTKKANQCNLNSSISALAIASDATILGCTRLTAPPPENEAATAEERRQRIISMKMQHQESSMSNLHHDSSRSLNEDLDVSTSQRRSATGVKAVGALRGLFRKTSKKRLPRDDSYSSFDKASNHSLLDSAMRKNSSSDSEEEACFFDNQSPKPRPLSERLSKQLRADLLADRPQVQDDEARESNHPSPRRTKSGTNLVKRHTSGGAQIRRNLSSQRVRSSRELAGSRHKSTLSLSAHQAKDVLSKDELSQDDDDGPQLPRLRSAGNMVAMKSSEHNRRTISLNRKTLSPTRRASSRDLGTTTRSKERSSDPSSTRSSRQKSAGDRFSHSSPKRGLPLQKDELGAEVKSSDRGPTRTKSGDFPTRSKERVRRTQSDKERRSSEGTVDPETMQPAKDRSWRRLMIPDLLDTDALGKGDSENEEAPATRRCPPRTRSGMSGIPRSQRETMRCVRRQSSGRSLTSAEEQPSGVSRGVRRQSSGRATMSPEMKSLEEQLKSLSTSRGGVTRQSSSRRALMSAEMKNLEVQPGSESRGGIQRQFSGRSVRSIEMKKLEKQDSGRSLPRRARSSSHSRPYPVTSPPCA